MIKLLTLEESPTYRKRNKSFSEGTTVNLNSAKSAHSRPLPLHLHEGPHFKSKTTDECLSNSVEPSENWNANL